MRSTQLLRMRASRSLRAGQDMPPVGGYEPVQYKVSLNRPRGAPVLPMTTFSAGQAQLGVGRIAWNQSKTLGQWQADMETAQPPRARVSTHLVHHRHGGHHDIRILQAWRWHQGVEVSAPGLFVDIPHCPIFPVVKQAKNGSNGS